jgi:diguanylate cyclase (GGDEF)-like protein
MEISRRVCETLASSAIEHGNLALGIRASVGVATASGPCTREELIKRADRALFRAKSDGGNRAVCEDEEPSA